MDKVDRKQLDRTRRELEWVEDLPPVDHEADEVDYTLALGDEQGVLRLLPAKEARIHIPPHSEVPFPVGTVIHIMNEAEQAFMVAGEGVNLDMDVDSKSARLGYTLLNTGLDDWELVSNPPVPYIPPIQLSSPPNGYQCRCDVQPITPDPYDVAKGPMAGPFIDEATMKRLDDRQRAASDKYRVLQNSVQAGVMTLDEAKRHIERIFKGEL